MLQVRFRLFPAFRIHFQIDLLSRSNLDLDLDLDSLGLDLDLDLESKLDLDSRSSLGSRIQVEYMLSEPNLVPWGAFSFVPPSERDKEMLVGHLGRNEGNWALLGPFI